MNQTRTAKISKVTKCRGCLGTDFRPWVDLGMQPIANNLLTREQLVEVEGAGFTEPFFPLAMMYCTNCELTQTTHVVDPDLLFKNYLYYSSISPVFREHFVALAEKTFNKDELQKGDLVVDIGSNDGVLLKPFKKLGAEVVGVEPAKTIAEKADKEGIVTLGEYFTRHLAEQIVKTKGKAKLITMTNAFAHVPDLDEIIAGVKALLAPGGRFMVEVAYLPDMLKFGTFDLLYHEHVCSWHLYPMSKFFTRHGMYIDAVEFIPVHGGSIRVYAKVGNMPQNVLVWQDQGLTRDKLFRNFPQKTAKTKEKLTNLLAELKRKRFQIIGYGAPAKMSTMTNYFNIGPETIDWIIDEAQSKQYHYSPGKHIKIVPPPEFGGYPGNYMFIFAWNFADSIMERARRSGYKGKFLIPFPKVRIV